MSYLLAAIMGMAFAFMYEPPWNVLLGGVTGLGFGCLFVGLRRFKAWARRAPRK